MDRVGLGGVGVDSGKYLMASRAAIIQGFRVCTLAVNTDRNEEHTWYKRGHVRQGPSAQVPYQAALDIGALALKAGDCPRLKPPLVIPIGVKHPGPINEKKVG